MGHAVVARVGTREREAAHCDGLGGHIGRGGAVIRHVSATCKRTGGAGAHQVHIVCAQFADVAAVDGGRCIAVVDLVVDAHAADGQRQWRDGGRGCGRGTGQHVVAGLACGITCTRGAIGQAVAGGGHSLASDCARCIGHVFARKRRGAVVQRQLFSHPPHRHARAHAAPVRDVGVGSTVIDLALSHQSRHRQLLGVDRQHPVLELDAVVDAAQTAGGDRIRTSIHSALAVAAVSDDAGEDTFIFTGREACIGDAVTPIECRAIVRFACVDGCDRQRLWCDARRRGSGAGNAVVGGVGAAQGDAAERHRFARCDILGVKGGTGVADRHHVTAHLAHQAAHRGDGGGAVAAVHAAGSGGVNQCQRLFVHRQCARARSRAVAQADQVGFDGVGRCAGPDVARGGIEATRDGVGRHVTIDQTRGADGGQQVAVGHGQRGAAQAGRGLLAVNRIQASAQVGPGGRGKVGGFVGVVSKAPGARRQTAQVGQASAARDAAAEQRGTAAAAHGHAGRATDDDVAACARACIGRDACVEHHRRYVAGE